MRARDPDETGYVTRDGVRVYYEVFGTGDPTILFCPTWTFVHSRIWKMQVPYLARHHRVIVFDPRGNGRSDRPTTVDAYAEAEFAQDAIDVLDATGTAQAVVVGLSKGAQRTLLLATEHPDRVLRVVFIGPVFPASRAPISAFFRATASPRLRGLFLRRSLLARSWGKFNAVHWRRNYRDFVEWFADLATREPHSTKGYEDVVGWAMEGDPQTLSRSWCAASAAPFTRRDQLALARRVQCPVLVIAGTKDKVTPFADARILAGATGGELVAVEGASHVPQVRHPVQTALSIREFVDPTFRRDRTAHRPDTRPRALMVCSPIGLGHARRDVAIARELRALLPDLQIDWLAQHPITRMLEEEGERVHPASKHLVAESAHIESEAHEHDLHAFQAIRRMDEILMANYMVFDDLTHDEHYDLWVGDEAWELDYHLHKNPSRKNAPFAWLTDFVGWLPMPDGGAHEAYLTADYNAEMVEHIRDHPGVRDRAIFVGNPEDCVPDRLGPNLPGIREWTERNFDFAGYVTGFDADALRDRERIRAEAGYLPRERVVLVTVGGSGVGEHLLRRVMAAFPAARALVPDLRMVVVTGPRIDPGALPAVEGLEVRSYVHDLPRHLAACDLAIVQGGLTTAMELTALGRPFLYFPLRHHFEQSFHVAHRLDRYRAGRRMDYDTATSDVLAQAIAEEVERVPAYEPVETDGARNAAARIAELLN